MHRERIIIPTLYQTKSIFRKVTRDNDDSKVNLHNEVVSDKEERCDPGESAHWDFSKFLH